MGILCPVILPATGVVTPRNTKFAQRRTVGSELVGHDGGWSDALLLQKFPHELECPAADRPSVPSDTSPSLSTARQTYNCFQAAPLAGWPLPEEFTTLRRLLEARMGLERIEMAIAFSP